MDIELTPKQLAQFALPVLKRLKQRDAEYYEERQAAGGWSNYCIHGTYIGDPYGPDYLCGACEDPESYSTYQEAIALARVQANIWNDAAGPLKELVRMRAITRDEAFEIHMRLLPA